MKKVFIPFPFLILLLSIMTITAFGQKQASIDIAQRYIEEQAEQWDLTQEDIANSKVSDLYSSRHNGLTHVFFAQQHENIPVYNAITGIHITTEGKVFYATNGFLPKLASSINTTSPAITAYQAIESAALNVGASLNTSLRLLSENNAAEYLYEGGNISNAEIKVRLIFQPIHKTGEVRLAWHLYIDQTDGSDIWSIRVDAVNGNILERNNLTVYCSFPEEQHGSDESCIDDFNTEKSIPTNQNFTFDDGASYNVFPFPTESPIHGERELVVNPSDPIASPFGWHDTNGQDGAEYEITRGNNTHAYLDLEDADSSTGGEPEGGASLTFDFPFDQSLEPDGYQDAAVSQLFYAVNAIHDFTFHYGFDEAAGNFQARNYTGEGSGGDYVRAEGQDGSGTNNANFATPADGGSGRMQMFVWDRVGGQLLTVLEPAGIAGGYETGTADYGPAVSIDPIVGEIVDAYDASNSPSLGCESIVNAEEVAGNIAMVDRGVCFFEEKTINAEAAGAIALIICNFEENANGMGGGVSGVDPGIPTVSLKRSTCQLFRQLLSEGVIVQIVLPDDNGPTNLDACFSNGVIAHEYGHGISNRLTGGPNQDGCLFNDEQMGEGWSDFFTLVHTVESGDLGEDPRGIGNYLIRAGITGGGIRGLPYTTDMGINNHSYDDVIGTTAPHPLGEVWATMLWDLYWTFADEFGFDEDQLTGTGGNNMAIQLVMDGMKLQGCNPGFIAGRDGILAADLINNEGANQCLIWEVFARRGLGYSADQGSVYNRNDGLEGYDIMPECITELKITKEVTPLIQAGDQILVTLTIRNHKEEAASGLIITDEIPNGTTYVAGSSNGVEPTVSGNMLSFEIDDINAGSTTTLIYKLNTADDLRSISAFYDGMEEGDGNWVFDAFEGNAIWDITTNDAFTGTHSWFVEDVAEENDQILDLIDPVPVTGTQPVLRFYHKYDTEFGLDGGFVQISTDGGTQWNNVDGIMFKNAYRGALAYTTFAIPNLNAFWGDSEGFVDTYIDLSSYIGEDILVRFRFGSDAEPDGATEDGIGWTIDDFEIMDMFNYNGEACVSSNEGDEACAIATSKGTIVEPDRTTAVENPIFESEIRIFPNPASETLGISFTTKQATSVNFEVISADGRVLLNTAQNFGEGMQHISLDIRNIPVGFYFVKISSDNEILTKKLVIE